MNPIFVAFVPLPHENGIVANGNVVNPQAVRLRVAPGVTVQELALWVDGDGVRLLRAALVNLAHQGQDSVVDFGEIDDLNGGWLAIDRVKVAVLIGAEEQRAELRARLGDKYQRSAHDLRPGVILDLYLPLRGMR